LNPAMEPGIKMLSSSPGESSVVVAPLGG